MFRPRRQGKFAPEFPEFQGFSLWKYPENFLTDRATGGGGLRLDHWKENFGPLRRDGGWGCFAAPAATHFVYSDKVGKTPFRNLRFLKISLRQFLCFHTPSIQRAGANQKAGIFSARCRSYAKFANRRVSLFIWRASRILSGTAGGHTGPPLRVLTDGADGRKHLIRHGLRPCHLPLKGKVRRAGSSRPTRCIFP